MYFIYSKTDGNGYAKEDTVYHQLQTLRGGLFTWCDRKITDKTRRLGAIREDRPEGMVLCGNCVKVDNLVTKKCEVDGCDSKHSAKGFCTKHYERFKRNGSTELTSERMVG